MCECCANPEELRQWREAAHRLERERDEARAEIAEALSEIALIQVQWADAATWREQIHAAERTRDEAAS